jgi:hypothetical protein
MEIIRDIVIISLRESSLFQNEGPEYEWDQTLK